MADGTHKPIKDIKPGDVVWAVDPETGEAGPREVTHIWPHGDSLVEFTIGDDTVTTTEDHPFWNATDHVWQGPELFEPGDMVLTADGQLLATDGLDANSWTYGAAYNLTVDDLHTYFVAAGDMDVLVHNCSPLADQIANGHGWAKHKGEFPEFANASDYARGVDNVLDNATDVRVGLERGRSAYWLDDTVVILDPNHIDGGTMFRPKNGYDYFLNELR